MNVCQECRTTYRTGERHACSPNSREQWRPHVGEPCQTRDGRKVRVICDDAKGPKDFPLVVLIEGPSGEYTEFRSSDGRDCIPVGKSPQLDMPGDLIPIPAAPRKQRVWLNVYEGKGGRLWAVAPTVDTRAEADERAMPGRLACQALDLEEGRFDQD